MHHDLTECKAAEATRLQEMDRVARAQAALNSIGDAVITTDLALRIDSLNPVAERLTGWRSEEARGQPLDLVYQIVNEETRQPAVNPAHRALANGVISKLADNTLLVSRRGEEFAIEDSAAPIRDREGTMLGCVLVFHDISERHLLHGQLAWQAGHDVLTGLPNRALLADRLHQAMAHAHRSRSLLAICFVDMDGFKPINDQYGHETGDQILKEVANRLTQTVRADDTVARLGGDEFVVLLTDMHDMDEVEPGLKRILDAIAMPYVLDETIRLNLSASMGVTVYPLDTAKPDTLLRHADQAMYKAKKNGYKTFSLFDVEQDRACQVQRENMNRLRQALANQQLQLYYQPKVNMRSGQVVGVEALIRWRQRKQGMVSPLEGLSLIERTSLIVEIGDWVLREALRQMSAWAQSGLIVPVSINLAAHELQSDDFLEKLKRALQAHPDIKSEWLELEVLESSSLDTPLISRVISACRHLGVTFALDDFGTGYSSLAYLKQLPVDTLKIDQSFVRGILYDPDDLALVEAVVSLARIFNRQAIAEGVETAEHGALLLRLGCDLAQGYGIARPMPAKDVPAWIAAYKPDPQWARWADRQWDLDDFRLIRAQLDHSQWVRQVLDTLADKPSSLSHDELVDPRLCHFGRWYRTDGLARYGHVPEMRAIEALHARLHEIGSEIVHLHLEGQAESARDLCAPLLSIRDQIVDCLERLSGTILRTPPQSHQGH